MFWCSSDVLCPSSKFMAWEGAKIVTHPRWWWWWWWWCMIVMLYYDVLWFIVITVYLYSHYMYHDNLSSLFFPTTSKSCLHHSGWAVTLQSSCKVSATCRRRHGTRVLKPHGPRRSRSLKVETGDFRYQKPSKTWRLQSCQIHLA